jgi:hypothetical protein
VKEAGKERFWSRLRRAKSPEEVALKIAIANLKRARRAHSAVVKTAEGKLHEGQSARRRALDDAQRGLRAAERTHQRTVQSTQNRLDQWINPGRGRKLNSYLGVTLYEHEILMPQGRAPTAGAHAVVEAAKRQESYLLVKASAVSGAFLVPPDGGLKARQFAAQVNSVASWALGFAEERVRTIPQLQAELLRVQSDVAGIDAARSRVAGIEADRELLAAIEVAERDVTAAKADTAGVDQLQARVDELNRILGRPVGNVRAIPPRRLLIGGLVLLILGLGIWSAAMISAVSQPEKTGPGPAIAGPGVSATTPPGLETSTTPWLYDPSANPVTPPPTPTPIPTPTPPPPPPAQPAPQPPQPAPPPVQAPPPPPPTPVSASCYPLTNAGKCYEPGEFCRTSDHGVTGRAGDGEKIICENKNGWRWEPA